MNFGIDIESPRYQITSQPAIKKSKSLSVGSELLSQLCKCKQCPLLIVDDITFNSQSLKLLIKQYYNVNIDIAIDGQEALQKFKSNLEAWSRTNCSSCHNSRYKLIFMDLQMPVMDGFQSSKEILEYQKTYPGPDCKIVALTAFANPSNIQKCQSAGMIDTLNKPAKL